METMHGTTILAVKRGNRVVMAGDGQVTMGPTAIKHTTRKVRRIYDDKVLVGFAGATADAFTLLERFEEKLRTYSGRLKRAAVELAKDWRMDKYLRRLEALLIVTDGKEILMLSGSGDVIEPDHDAVAVGSGGSYAYSAAKALLDHNPDMDAEAIVLAAMAIAAEICVYTNGNVVMETIEAP